MAKMIKPSEIGSIISGLLVEPEIFGQTFYGEEYRMFVRDLGEVVTRYFDGAISDALMPSGPEEDSCVWREDVLLAVHMDDSESNSVWAYHDREGWEEEGGMLVAEENASMMRERLRSLLVNASFEIDDNPSCTIANVTMQDWRINAGESLEAEHDDDLYMATLQIGNQIGIEINDFSDIKQLGVTIEINKGVPSIHVGTKDAELLHIHVAQGGLVVTAGDDSDVTKAAADRYAYGNSNSLLFSEVD